MIQSFRRKGLGKFYASANCAEIQPRHAKRLRMLLAALDTAQSIEDMDVAEFRLHALKGTVPRCWSVWVNGNWRLTLEFKDGHAFNLHYEDYH